MNITTASDINQAHRLARGHAESAVQHAIRCGELLALKKTELRHGEFKPWIAANCEFSYQSANAYMKAASQKSSALDFSSLRMALGYDKPEREAAEHDSEAACDGFHVPLDLLESVREDMRGRVVVMGRTREGGTIAVQESAHLRGFADVVAVMFGPRGWRDFHIMRADEPVEFRNVAHIVHGWFCPEWWEATYLERKGMGATREFIERLAAIDRGEYAEVAA